MKSILHKVTRADVVPDPFPHVVVDGALEDSLYQQLAATFPPAEAIVHGRPLENNTTYRARGADLLADVRVAPAWKELVEYHTSEAFFREVVKVFGAAITELHPALELTGPVAQRPALWNASDGTNRTDRTNRTYGTEEAAPSPIRPIRPIGPIAPTQPITLDCQAAWGSPVTSPSSSNLCHVDREVALYAGLLYCRLPQDDAVGGDLELYRFRGAERRYDAQRFVDMSLVEPVRRIPYAANRLVFFLHSPRSLHGVTERAVTQWPRLHVNFLAEMPTKVFDLARAV